MANDQTKLERIGTALYRRGLWFAAEEYLYRWLLEMRHAGDSIQLVRALNANGAAQLALRKITEARSFFCEAHHLVEKQPVPSHARVRVLANLCSTYILQKKPQKALEWALRARSSYDHECPTPLRALVEQAIGAAHISQGNWSEAATASQTALKNYTQAGDHLGAAQVRSNLGLIMLELGEYDAARTFLLEALETMTHGSGDSPIAYLYTELGRLSHRTGDIQQAMAYGSQALEVLWRNMAIMDKEEIARLSELFGAITWLAGDRQGAINDLQRAATYYAQQRMWRQWTTVNQQLDRWVRHDQQVPGTGLRIQAEERARLRYLTTLLGLMDSLESLFPDLRGKADLNTQYALLLGDAMGLPQQDRETLCHAGRLHDVGLTSIDAEIVQGTQPVSTVATERMQTHPQLSVQLLSLFPVPDDCLAAVKHHHERFDGTGYPDGLRGEQIPLVARIISVADAYVTTVLHSSGTQPAEQARHLTALNQLQSEAGKSFDPHIVDTFVRMHEVE